MKIETISEIKKELRHQSKDELLALCLRLARFKNENKALLTYLLFLSHDEDDYIANVKITLDKDFKNMNCDSYFYMKKTIRKIMRLIRTYSRYSSHKSTEIELLLYFCKQLNTLTPNIHRNKTLSNLYQRQIVSISKKIEGLHEDLQYDYNIQLEPLRQY